MTREEFVDGYMARSGVKDWQLEGEIVHFAGAERYVLPCRCDDEMCEGWAMVPPSTRGWHLFQNTDGMSIEEANALDRAAMEEERLGWHAKNGFEDRTWNE